MLSRRAFARERFRQAGEIDAVEEDFAAVGMIERADEMQQRAFAAAGFAHHRQRLAGVERQIDAAQHGQRPLGRGVGFSQIGDAQQRRARRE